MKLPLLAILLSFSQIINAQEFGGNPPSKKWLQVNSPSSRIIYPAGIDSTAMRIADIITHLHNTTSNTIGPRMKKVDVILHNQTTISNAFVMLGPFHSEFYLTPAQNSFELGSLKWPDLLAVHEYRHVQQYNNFNVGISHAARVIFGELGQALANGMAVPDWFFEGEAVYSETNVSKQGRGRLPLFHNTYRSLWQAGKNYSWMKMRNGSLKDYVPDHYALGYLLVAYGREKYGDEFWKKVTYDAASFKSPVYPFQSAVKKHTGRSYVQFRNEALQFFKDKYQPQAQIASAKGNNFYNEENPAFTENDELIYVNSSYKKIPVFTIRKGNSERKIRTLDIVPDYYYSYGAGKIVYVSSHPDARWGNIHYSDIQVLDVSSGKQKTITHSSRYFAPDISDDGKIVAVSLETDDRSSLHILNAETGEVNIRVPNPENVFYTHPKFLSSTKIISTVRDTRGEMFLTLINITDGSMERLTPASFAAKGFPVIKNDTIYFTATHQESDKLFAFTLSDKKLYLLSSPLLESGLGNYQVAVNDNKIVWSTFSANGFRLVEQEKRSVKWTQVTAITPGTFGAASVDKTNANLLATVPALQYEAKKYPATKGLFNFHSLIPNADDPEYMLTLQGNNVLNTLQSELSFTYDRSERWKKFGFSETFGGFFPLLSASVDYTIDRAGLYRNNIVYWNEIEPQLGITVPLNFSKGRSFTRSNFGTRYVYNQTDFQGKYKDTFGRINYSYLNNNFFISNQIQAARQQVSPRLAQSLNLNYKNALTEVKGWQFVANGNLYLPGLMKTHSLHFNGAFLKKDTSRQLNFSSGFPFSRGYQAQNLTRMFKWGVNYQLPLFLPDAGFGNIVYFLRVRSNLFYDDTHVKNYLAGGRFFTSMFRSVGTEIFFDTKWWNQAEVSFGVRYSHLLDNDLFGSKGNNRWEIILPVNLFEQ